jgi:hypothetical protein
MLGMAMAATGGFLSGMAPSYGEHHGHALLAGLILLWLLPIVIAKISWKEFDLQFPAKKKPHIPKCRRCGANSTCSIGADIWYCDQCFQELNKIANTINIQRDLP